MGRLLVGAVGAHLHACGFHQHKGQWRKRRRRQEDQPVTTIAAPAPASEKAAPEPRTYTRSQIIEIQKRADRKNASTEDRAALRQLYDDQPWLARYYGDLAAYAQRRLMEETISQMSISVAVQRQLDKLRADLGYADAPVLERMLIEQVALTWMRLQVAELAYTNVIHSSEGYTFARATHYERMLSASQARHMRAVETLARVRRLSQRTPVQINIGAQQVNMAGEVRE
jgi:hypothetical protein